MSLRLKSCVNASPAPMVGDSKLRPNGPAEKLNGSTGSSKNRRAKASTSTLMWKKLLLVPFDSTVCDPVVLAPVPAVVRVGQAKVRLIGVSGIPKVNERFGESLSIGSLAAV